MTPSPDYVWFLFVASPETPEHGARRIERYLFAKSPLVRWVVTNAKELMEIVGRYPDPVVVFWWPSRAEQAVVGLSKELERQPVRPKVMILREYSAAPGQVSGELDRFAEGYKLVSVLDRFPPDKQIRDGLRKLGVLRRLKKFKLRLNNTSADPALPKMIETIGPNVLTRLIAWHFPKAASARVFPVEGGWSGTPLCRFYVDGDPQEYFLKLHGDAGGYVAEFSRHKLAQSWLRRRGTRRAVELVPVDQAPVGRKQAQKRIFSGEKKPFWPVCYKSASEITKRRQMWGWLFSQRPPQFQLDVLDTLLETLAFKNHSPKYEPESLWSLLRAGDPQATAVDRHRELVFVRDTQIALEKALDDLEPYGQVMCKAAADASTWKSRGEDLSQLVHGILPDWLHEGQHYVALGHVHGDPNPPNCMVKAGDPNNPEDPGNAKDIQLIDCGNYLKDGRLVWDLAIIERDIKLVLMHATLDDPGYKELDPNRLAGWCDLERRLTAQLAFVPSAAAPLAEQLLARVRKRAQVLSQGDGHAHADPMGYHYFAALLYCTLTSSKNRYFAPPRNCSRSTLHLKS